MAGKVKSAPRAPGPCDFCGAMPAPFGYQPPGGARALKPGKRPMRACADPGCKAKAEPRLAAFNAPIARAPVDPPAALASATPRRAPRTPRQNTAQKSLF